jgi:hypothetical protein
VSTLRKNEQVKLLANALDRASTAALTVGVLAPVAATLYDLGVPATPMWLLIAGALVWLFAAIALHLLAQVILGALTP